MSLEDRFWTKVDKSGDCWIWTGANTGLKEKRGRLRLNGKDIMATHVAWLLEKGVLPTLKLLHKCDNPPCVRVNHLFEGTMKENVRDMFDKGRANRIKEFCKRGHSLKEGNLYLKFDKRYNKIQRECLSCRRIREGQRYADKGTMVQSSGSSA